MLIAIAKRFGIVLMGYGAACVATGIAIRSLSALLFYWQGVAIDEYEAAAKSPVQDVWLVALMTAIFMAIPIFLTLPFLEVGEVRNPVVYSLVGGAWAVLMFILIFKAIFSLTLVFALSGVIAGLVYWAIAGRRAGQVWR